MYPLYLETFKNEKLNKGGLKKCPFFYMKICYQVKELLIMLILIQHILVLFSDHSRDKIIHV